MMVDGYLEGLDTLYYAFTEMLDSALEKERYQYQSYDELNDYYWYLDEAERKIKQGYAILREVEDEFAIVQHMGLKRRTEIQEKYELLEKVNMHTRMMTLSYYRLDHQLHAFMDTINQNRFDAASTIHEHGISSCQVHQRGLTCAKRNRQFARQFI